MSEAKANVPVLRLENITMQFGGVVAINNLSLEVNQGEIVALIGPNGAGKTTAFNCVTGVYEPTNGIVEFHGKPIVVNFWATWCPYCVQELPLFDEYAREYSGDIDFMIVDLADGYRETIEMAKKYVADYGYSFPVYFDTTGGSMYAYGITGIPVTLFIDSDGNLMTQHVGAIDEDTLLRNIQALVG